jgi:biotin carboxyl carrier protein
MATAITGGWQAEGRAAGNPMKYYVELSGTEIGLEVLHTQHGTVIRPSEDGDVLAPAHVDFEAVHASPETGEGLYSLIVDGRSYQLYVQQTGTRAYKLAVSRYRFDTNVLTEREWRLKKVAPRQVTQSGEVTVSAPMPGLVKSVLVNVGDSVARGQRLLVLEAMKMENDLTSPAEGKVARLNVQSGTVVDGGKALLVIEA